MGIPLDVYDQIRKSYLDGKSLRKIAEDLGIARKTVKKYCKGEHLPGQRKKAVRESTVTTDEVIAFIEKCLEEDEQEGERKQKHTAKRIYDRLRAEKGFKGGESTVRLKVRELNEKRAKVFLPLQFEPGEAIQVDWGEAKIYIAGNREKINIFCARLCYSCKPIVIAYWRQNEESFLDAYVRIFNLLSGVPKKVIFDNARVAVKEGFGVHAKKQESYSKLCAHYGFTAEFCNPASGHEKGLVEGLVGWARRNMLVPLPKVESLNDLNILLQTRCVEYAKTKIPGKPDTVGAMFEIEKAALRPLPIYPFETAKSQNARVSAFSTVRFQTNEYSVPTRYVGKQVGIKGFPEKVEIYYEGERIADHARLWGKNERSCRLIDYLELLEERGRAVLNAVPVKQTLSKEAYEELKANINDHKKVIEILRREAGLPQEEIKEETTAQILTKPDPLEVKEVDLKCYDTLMAW